MAADDLRLELLTPQGIALFRRTVTDHYGWFMHESAFERVDTIRREGLQPRNPGCGVPDVVVSTFKGSDGIVCLNPLGSRHAKSSHAGHIFRMGIRAADLPPRLGIDWSYPESWSLRGVTDAQLAGFGRDGAILYVVDDTGSIASYDPIPASVLRVCTKGKHGLFPSTWPLLSSVGNDEIFTIDRSGV